jgi:hypothetical protein
MAFVGYWDWGMLRCWDAGMQGCWDAGIGYFTELHRGGAFGLSCAQGCVAKGRKGGAKIRQGCFTELHREGAFGWR